MAASPMTQPSLPLRIRDAQDAPAWSQFAELYVPLIQGFARQYGLREADAADVTQEVLRRIAQAIKQMDYDPRRGSFRAWLYTVVRNQVRKSLGKKRPHDCGTGGTEAQLLLEGQH